MKTKNAFAFRDFDSARILQRPFFKNFYFDPNKSDAEILKSLNITTDDSVDSSEEKLYAIKAILEHLAKFRHLIDRHNETRLDKYNKKKSEAKGITIAELQRPAMGLFFLTNNCQTPSNLLQYFLTGKFLL